MNGSISVVICAYTEERWTDLVAALNSLRTQTIPPGEIIVVIDHNPELLVRARGEIPDVQFIDNRDLQGASGARNTGVAAASSSIVAFLDDDAEAFPDWLEKLGTLFKDSTVLGVGGSLEPIWMEGRPAWFPEEFDWVVGCTYPGLPASAGRVRNLIAANMAVRKDVFEAVGGFRSGYGNVKSEKAKKVPWLRSVAGDEETEFCIQAGMLFPERFWLYEPTARAHHRVPAIRARLSYYLRRCYDEGLGKAQLSRFVGATRGLAAERTYVLYTLPKGVVRGCLDAIRLRDAAGLARAAAIVGGLGATVIGYVIGILWIPGQSQANVARVDRQQRSTGDT